MKTALYQNRRIGLENLARDQYQKIYLSGKNGDLSCPVCQEKVRLFLGIHDQPRFYHVNAPEKNCAIPLREEKETEKETIYVERNGFRFPQGRTIIESEKSVDLFRPAKAIETKTPFKDAGVVNNLEQLPYL
ncbi:MAG: ATP-dependent helicase, partial [Neobacillus sp.]|nr:ATP-dependent helicase [Neobacillus sp.]